MLRKALIFYTLKALSKAHNNLCCRILQWTNQNQKKNTIVNFNKILLGNLNKNLL